MNRKAKLATALAVALFVSGVVWLTQGRDPERPTAPAPRGQFATDRAAEEPALPVPSKP